MSTVQSRRVSLEVRFSATRVLPRNLSAFRYQRTTRCSGALKLTHSVRSGFAPAVYAFPLKLPLVLTPAKSPTRRSMFAACKTCLPCRATASAFFGITFDAFEFCLASPSLLWRALYMLRFGILANWILRPIIGRERCTHHARVVVALVVLGGAGSADRARCFQLRVK